MSHILTTSILALALTAGTAMAQPPAAAPPADSLGSPNRSPDGGAGGQARPFGGRRAFGGGAIAAIDTDKDGLISKNEWTMAGRPAARFDMMDINKDGKLDRQEIASARGAVARGGGTLGAQPGAGRRGLRSGQSGGDTPPPAVPTS